MKMTALEMAEKFTWAEVTVHFHDEENRYFGHVTLAGKTRIIRATDNVGQAVWVDKLALGFDKIVDVSQETAEGCVVKVYPKVA